jgi:hypothetical protein
MNLLLRKSSILASQNIKLKSNNVLHIENIIQGFDAVSLKELDSVQLQNRVDTKYVLTIAQLAELLNGIQDEQFVLTIDKNRLFNYKTIYYDTPSFQFYKDHHNGCVNRVKVRSRQYVESNLCFYEIKRKLFGTRTDKQRIKIPALFDEVPHDAYNLIQYKRLNNQPIEKKLSNYFKRITLTNKKFTERITIDLEIKFENQHQTIELPHIVIIEVKQGKTDVFSNTIQQLKKLRIHESSFSKYVVGVSMLEPHIKNNNFKPLLLKINKLKNNAKY